jgi:hypothetical protein
LSQQAAAQQMTAQQQQQQRAAAVCCSAFLLGCVAAGRTWSGGCHALLLAPPHLQKQ